MGYLSINIKIITFLLKKYGGIKNNYYFCRNLVKQQTMTTFRKIAFKEYLSRVADAAPQNVKPTELFGRCVFTIEKMKTYLPLPVIEKIEDSIKTGKQIDRDISEIVATGLKNWAISMHVTHYTHWFQPLTGETAEKHDAFLNIENNRPVETLSGVNLIQQEPDASSFPSGGLRNTFEARGYTAWDPSSPAFIIEHTLCIPTVFISYTGESLDFKAPLIKSLFALDKAATAVCQYVDKNINKVNVTLGIEQEYFLVDSALYHARPDLVLAGRTLFGHEASKGQQLEDHYFGSIPDRVILFMEEYERMGWELGIPIKTRHNEVAPCQFETASMFEEANLANDHNQLLMFIMRKAARKHHFEIIFHEKPYAGINGSGKHNNWSLATDTGRNLLSPGKNPKSNLLFLSFFINTIKAFDDHADLLRASIASSSNDLRLGANEAPPAIMSIFIGHYLEKVLNDFSQKVSDDKLSPEQKTELKLNIIKIPPILLDNTDRNRTSPFAFTGNKFEFRSVGSSENCAAAMIALNTAMASQLLIFKKEVDKRVAKGFEKDEAMYYVLKQVYNSAKKRIFQGNGYGVEWIEEAKRRGLSMISNTPEALLSYISDKTKGIFEGQNILSGKELEARYEIKLEKYFKKIQIESRVIADIAQNHIIPCAFKYQNTLIQNVQGLKSLYSADQFKQLANQQLSMIEEISVRTNELLRLITDMTEARKKANNISEIAERAKEYCEVVVPFFDKIRYHTDKLELIVSDEEWVLPKYRELLFMN